MKSLAVIVLGLFAYDMLIRHGIGVQHLVAAMNAFFASIGAWVYH